MRIGPSGRDVEAVGGKQSKFKIKASGKAFRALQDSLYSNKYESIVRELWSNAYDAHRAVGKLDTPFWIQIPNRFDLHFKVRDFGPGLSPDDIENVYTVYFESTKDQSDDDIGGFGLGAKTPYSYTDTFNVISYQNGKKYIYNAYIDENDEPNMILMGEQQTTEPDGLEVSFPVKPNDASNFESAAKWYYKGFKIKPVYYGHVQHKVSPEEYALSGVPTGWEEWEFTETIGDFSLINDELNRYGWRSSKNRVYALLGCVPYSINPSHFEGEHSQFLSKMNGVLHFKVGELAPTLSRESLSYGANEPTVASIKKKISETLNLMAKTYQEKFDKAKSEFEKYVLTNQFPTLIRSYIRGCNQYTDNYQRGPWTDQTWGEVHQYTPIRRSRWGKNYRIQPDKTTVYIEQEVKTKETKKDVRAKKRIEEAHQDKGQLLWFKHQGDKNSNDKLIELMTFFGDDPEYIEYHLVADLPDAGPATRVKSKPVAIRAWDQRGYCEEVSLDDTEFDKGGYYVKYSNGYCNDTIESRFSSSPSVVKATGVIPDDKLYCVPKTYWKKFEKADQWIYAEPLWLEWYNKDKDDKEKFAQRTQIENYYPKTLLKLKGEVIDGLNKYYQQTQEVKWGVTPQQMAKLFRGVVSYNSPQELQLRLKYLKEKYPMFRAEGWDRLDTQILQDYIDLMNSKLHTVELEDVA